MRPSENPARNGGVFVVLSLGIEPQKAGELAADEQIELAQTFERHEIHDLDELAQFAAQVFTIVAFDRQMQVLGQAAIAFGGARVKLNHHGRGGCGDQRLQLRPAGLQRRRAGLQLVHGDDLFHEHHLGAFQLASDLRQFTLGRRSSGEGFRTPGGLSLVEETHRFGDRLGRQQMLSDAGEHPLFDRAGGDDLVVGAGAALACGAAGVLAAIQRHARPAQAALHEPRQQAFGLTGIRGWLVGQRRLAVLRRPPGLIIQNAKVGHRLAQPFFRRVEHRRTSAGVRVFAIAAAVEHAHANVKLLMEDAVLRPAVAIDSGRRPLAAARTRLAFSVELMSDRPGRNTVGIGLEDPTNDAGLMVVDLQDAFFDNVITVTAAAP